MKRRFATAYLISIVLLALAFIPISTQQGISDYDPWYDVNDDGKIDIKDIAGMAKKFGTTGTPINKTELLLELEARVDALNATVMDLQAQATCVVQSGEYDGEVNSDMVEDSGANTVINFQNPFTTTEKPQMIIIVVLKQATNGLTEGSAIRAVEDIKGAANNWTGFDITVSKYSDGTSIDDTTQVYVTWIAIGTGNVGTTRAHASTFTDSTDGSGNVYVSYPIGKFAATPDLSVTAQFNSGGLAQMGYVTVSSHTSSGFTLNVKDGSGSNWASSAVQISYVAIQE